MDRDKRWDRVQIALKGLVSGEGVASEDPLATIKEKYEQGENDEFFKPIIVNGDDGRLKGLSEVPLTVITILTKPYRQRHLLLLQLPR